MIVGLGKAGVKPGVLRVAPFESVAAHRLLRIVVAVVPVTTGAVAHGLGNVTGLLDEAAELADRHFGLAEVEIARDAHAMDGRLVTELEEALAVVLRIVGGQRVGRLIAAHHELAGGNANKRHVERVDRHFGRCGGSQADESQRGNAKPSPG